MLNTAVTAEEKIVGSRYRLKMERSHVHITSLTILNLPISFAIQNVLGNSNMQLTLYLLYESTVKCSLALVYPDHVSFFTSTTNQHIDSARQQLLTTVVHT